MHQRGVLEIGLLGDFLTVHTVCSQIPNAGGGGGGMVCKRGGVDLLQGWGGGGGHTAGQQTFKGLFYFQNAIRRLLLFQYG